MALTANFIKTRAFDPSYFDDDAGVECFGGMAVASRKWSETGRQDVISNTPRLEAPGKYSAEALLKHWK